MTTQKRNEDNLSRSGDLLEGQLTAALEAIPQFAIADDFAARVMSRVPAHKVLQYRLPMTASIGRRVSMVAVAILLIAMLAFAAQTGGANAAIRTVAESIFALEFASLTAWLTLRPRESQ